ncbi:MAG: hypothetical protein IT162_13940 [Bryobacterales bacterium]|nr:hypothetical protein [Bryobacterales bacterium]
MIKLNSLRRRGRRGNAIVELGLLAIPLTTMLMSTVVVGLNLGRSIHASQVNRDAGSLFSRGVDFSADFNKDILVRLAQGLGITRTGGSGVIIFSTVTWLPQSKCTALGLGGCNADKHVIIQRLTIGDPALRTSSVGTPAANLIDSKGLINNYMVDDSTIATFPWMQLSENEFAFVAESYFASPDFDLFGFQEGTGVYSISVY